MCEAIESYGYDRHNEGRAEGRAEGIAQGRAEGKEEGRVEGKLEKAREMAIALFRKNVPVDTIAAAASVPVEVVRQWLGIDVPQ